MASLSDLAFQLVFLFLFLNVSCTPLCHRDERLALLQFRRSFIIDRAASSYFLSYPKVASWNNTDCCLWDGVECNETTGYVIGLDLSSSCLYGSFNSNSSLFYLSHLRKLNLGDNDFNFSPIPSKIASFSNLTYLNLSLSVFSGQISMELSELSNLVSLDLHGNHLSLANFGKFVQNMTKLETLDLNHANISSPLPDIFRSFHSLSSLSLQDCNLIGSIPPSIADLNGSLASLDLSFNNFEGPVPSWLENLTELFFLDLSNNNFTMGGFSWLGKQIKLKYLSLYAINLVGEVPSILRNLTQLEYLHLGQNMLRGRIPSWISNITKLIQLDLGFNEFHGTVEFEMFAKMEQLTGLTISHNSLTLVTNLSGNATLSQFETLAFASCNMREFPDFLRHQNQLSWLQLADNNIEGHIPNWIGNVGKESLLMLDLSINSFSGFGDPLAFSQLKNLVHVYLDDNLLKGSLPSLSLSVQYFRISDNYLTGKIPSSFCNLESLAYFDLANNNLDGPVPQCLGNFSDSLVLLSLANNSFNGPFPNIFGRASRLRMIDLSDNQLEGSMPRSVANCEMLEYLDISNNEIFDRFPVWLGSLPKLEVVNLRSNYLFGELESLPMTYPFSKLRILDLSHNELTGTIPSRFFETFTSMKGFDLDQVKYMQATTTTIDGIGRITSGYTYQIVVANKGMYMRYWKVPNVLAAIDFSSNKFQGLIPESIANVKMVNVLNLSNNHLSGRIPSFFSNLTNLESLDLSLNQLIGVIPEQMTKLTFLEYFNVSNNQLTGPLPQGKQFGTFDNTSYKGNSGLCGFPLTKQCGNSVGSALPRDGGSKHSIDVTWKSVVIGYGSGIVVGLLLGLIFYGRHQNWILHTFARRQMKRTRKWQRRSIP